MLSHPVALVTGGARGIGRGICAALARLGYAVGINYRASETEARAVAEECRAAGAPAAMPMQADVARAADREALIAGVFRAWGRLDLLVNNAGIGPRVRCDLLEVTPASWHEVLQANLEGPFFLSQLAASQMIPLARQGRLVRPALVNISSISAVTPSTNRGEYCVAKAGLSMVTQLFAHRLAEEGIGVYEIRPGIIRTDMTRGVAEKYDRLFAEGLTPIRRWGTPEDVALAVAAIAAGSFPYSTGEVFHVDGGFHSRAL